MSLDGAGLAGLAWRTANCNQGACVEIAPLRDQIAIRDSKNPAGPVLVYDKEEWQTFVVGVKRGDFDDLLS